MKKSMWLVVIVMGFICATVRAEGSSQQDNQRVKRQLSALATGAKLFYRNASYQVLPEVVYKEPSTDAELIFKGAHYTLYKEPSAGKEPSASKEPSTANTPYGHYQVVFDHSSGNIGIITGDIKVNLKEPSEGVEQDCTDHELLVAQFKELDYLDDSLYANSCMPHLNLAFLNVKDNRNIPTIISNIREQALVTIDRVDAEIKVNFASTH